MGKSITILTAVSAIMIFIGIYLIFAYAPMEQSMLEIQKVFYFHVSSAFTAFAAFGVNFVLCIMFLIKRKALHDILAVASAEIGLLFCTAVLLSGPIWARVSWNTWWTWEPRLTTTLVMWLMYVGYFILRAILSGETRRTFSAVLGIFAGLNVPIVYHSVNIWQAASNMHPGTNTKYDMASSMKLTFWFVVLAFLSFYVLMLFLQYRMGKSNLQYETIRQRKLGEI